MLKGLSDQQLAYSLCLIPLQFNALSVKVCARNVLLEWRVISNEILIMQCNLRFLDSFGFS